MGIHSIARVALDLDAEGVAHRAIVRGRFSPVALLCTQNVSGSDFAGTYELLPDTAAPIVADATARLPWETGLALSEPATLPPGSTATLSPSGMTLTPPLEGGLLARAGKTFAFVFPDLADGSGHASSAAASLTFRDLGPGIPAETFGEAGSCTSTTSATGFARLVTKPGATRIDVRLCHQQGFGQVVCGCRARRASHCCRPCSSPKAASRPRCRCRRGPRSSPSTALLVSRQSRGPRSNDGGTGASAGISHPPCGVP